MPEATQVAGLGALITDWEHASNFVFTEELMVKTLLELDGKEFEWQQLLELEDTPLATIFGDAEAPVLLLATPPQQQVTEELLPVVNALDEQLEALPIAAGVTVVQIKEQPSAAYTGDLDATLVQIRGSNGCSFFSFKVSVIPEPTMELIACIEARLSKVPELMRPPLPKAASELRLKLALGVEPKAASPPTDKEPVESECSSLTKAKVMKAMKRDAEAVIQSRLRTFSGC